MKALLIALALLALYAVPVAAQDDQNCPSFESQAAAQEHLRNDPTDPDQLDGNDDDGRACEGNPAPYDLEPVQEAIGNGATQPTATPEETPEATETPEPTVGPQPTPTDEVDNKQDEDVDDDQHEDTPEEMPDTGAGGLATSPVAPAAAGLLTLAGAAYAVVRRR